MLEDGPDATLRHRTDEGDVVKDVGIWIGLALVGVTAAVLLLNGGTATPEVAPEFTLRSLDGTNVSLSQFRGDVVILDFWATWCKPCTTTFPRLHALQEAYSEQGVILVGVSLDRSEQQAREYLVESGYATDTMLWGSLDQARAVKELYDVGGIPRTFVIDREGVIRFAGHPSRLDASALEAWL